ncbi:glycosyl hydrolase [Micromonospora sp. DT53]|uniref:glycosyl hydrolase n=1 Tax=Micromonospora sp. DT53 TaxID=3393444 RepID=UPI003CEACC95
MVRTDPRNFADPGAGQRPRVRWWWPGGAVSGPQIEHELRALHDAGFSRAEIALLPMGLPDSVPSESVRSWGTPEFTERLADALRTARRYGMRIDLTVSPGWPMASPAVGGDRNHLAQRKLVRGSRTLAGGATIAEIPPPEGDRTATDQLVAVTAVRVLVDAAEPARPVMLDEDSAVDLTGRVAAGELCWTAPCEGEWLVFSFWSRASGQRSVAEASMLDAPVIDHFSAEAVAVAIEHIDQFVLPASLDPLLAEAGGDIFEDSLEIATDAELWTASFLTEFARRRGYDLTPYLPVVRVDRLYRFDWETLLAGITPDSPADYDLPDGRGRRIRHDYYRTLNELYVDHHVTPLTRWANRRGLRYRAQPYGNTMDQVEIAGAVQIPESEDLVSWIAAGGMTDGAVAYERVLDFHRGIAAAAHMTGGRVVSLECCAVLNADYQTDLAALQRHVDRAFSAGVNQLVLHGVPYQGVPGAAWPGWAPFANDSSPEVSDAWGPRQPMWRHMRAYADYVARTATVLQHGRPRVDVAIYKQAYWCLAWPKITVPGLADAGYTYEFLTPSLLEHDNAVVRGGRLAPDQAAYRALVIDHEPAMEPGVLRRIRGLARQGLPVVVVGPPPCRATGFRDADRRDQEVERLAAELLTLPRVRRVDDQAHILDALDELGVQPDARLHGASGVVSVHRAADDGDYYHLTNLGADQARLRADLRGAGDARILDPWRGTSHPLPGPVTPDRRSVALRLGRGESTIVFLGTGAGLRARPVQTPAPAVPVVPRWERELTDWDLDVADWRPDGTVRHRLRLGALADWRTIEPLGDAAGIGTYRADAELPAGSADGVDAVLLDLGRVAGTVRLEVNGRTVPVDCTTGRTPDVRPWLREGPNQITIEVATTLGNRLIALGRAGDAAYARLAARPTLPAGLLGPVHLRGVTVRADPSGSRDGSSVAEGWLEESSLG